VIVVDDGSRDRTGVVADRLAASNPLVRVIHHSANRGYGAGAAQRFPGCELFPCDPRDGDNQFDLGELPVLVRALKGFDVVSGYRITRSDRRFAGCTRFYTTGLPACSSTFR
jgi:glycosyltransferase involved in cell wall biosynthesis